MVQNIGTNVCGVRLAGYNVIKKQPPLNHERIFSVSTTSSSPSSGEDNQAQQTATFGRKRILAASPSKLQKGRRKIAGENHIKTGVEVQKLCKRSAVVSTPVKRVDNLPCIVQSPNGSDYIITPGRSRIDLNEFMASFDKQRVKDSETQGVPCVRNFALYGDYQHTCWRKVENSLPTGVFNLSFHESSALEDFRRMAVVCVFNYAIKAQLMESTIHSAVLNVSRLLWSHVSKTESKRLTDELFACTVMAAVRTAVKFEETFLVSSRFRIDPNYIWTASGFCEGIVMDKSLSKLNAAENEALEILQHPLNPPVAPDFLDRYLIVGGWKEYLSEYRELASYILGLSLFSFGESNSLREIPCSKLAAAALVLAVKIINTDEEFVDYEYWPERLVRYTGYELDELKQGIIGLSKIMRNKPPISKVIEKYYRKWGCFDWK